MLFKIRLDLEQEMEFSFIELPKGSRVTVKHSFLTKLLELIDDNEQYFTTAIVKEARDSQGHDLEKIFKNFYVLFYTVHETRIKRGILIAYDNDNKGLVTGAWPTSFRDTCITNPKELASNITNIAIHPER
ncbi:MAG: hypothetical protein ACTSUE_24750, partial [Promethearchaeota archaeon]